MNKVNKKGLLFFAIILFMFAFVNNVNAAHVIGGGAGGTGSGSGSGGWGDALSGVRVTLVYKDGSRVSDKGYIDYVFNSETKNVSSDGGTKYYYCSDRFAGSVSKNNCNINKVKVKKHWKGESTNYSDAYTYIEALKKYLKNDDKNNTFFKVIIKDITGSSDISKYGKDGYYLLLEPIFRITDGNGVRRLGTSVQLLEIMRRDSSGSSWDGFITHPAWTNLLGNNFMYPAFYRAYLTDKEIKNEKFDDVLKRVGVNKNSGCYSSGTKCRQLLQAVCNRHNSNGSYTGTCNIRNTGYGLNLVYIKDIINSGDINLSCGITANLCKTNTADLSFKDPGSKCIMYNPAYVVNDLVDSNGNPLGITAYCREEYEIRNTNILNTFKGKTFELNQSINTIPGSGTTNYIKVTRTCYSTSSKINNADVIRGNSIVKKLNFNGKAYEYAAPMDKSQNTIKKGTMDIKFGTVDKKEIKKSGVYYNKASKVFYLEGKTVKLTKEKPKTAIMEYSNIGINKNHFSKYLAGNGATSTSYDGNYDSKTGEVAKGNDDLIINYNNTISKKANGGVVSCPVTFKVKKVEKFECPTKTTKCDFSKGVLASVDGPEDVGCLVNNPIYTVTGSSGADAEGCTYDFSIKLEKGSNSLLGILEKNKFISGVFYPIDAKVGHVKIKRVCNAKFSSKTLTNAYNKYLNQMPSFPKNPTLIYLDFEGKKYNIKNDNKIDKITKKYGPDIVEQYVDYTYDCSYTTTEKDPKTGKVTTTTVSRQCTGQRVDRYDYYYTKTATRDYDMIISPINKNINVVTGNVDTSKISGLIEQQSKGYYIYTNIGTRTSKYNEAKLYYDLGSDYFVNNQKDETYTETNGSEVIENQFDNEGSGENLSRYDYCPINYEVINKLVPEDDECVGNNCTGLTVQYRTISLTNPFPGKNGTGRTPGSNWNGSVNGRSFKEEYITRAGDSVYNNSPIYTVTLDTAKIRSIRAYNRSHEYGDFELTCEKNTGRRCVSTFLNRSELSVGGACSNANNHSSGNFYSCAGKGSESGGYKK